MVVENNNYVELAKKFIDEHNNNNNWSPLDRIEMTAIIMFAEWLENNRLSLEKKEIFNNGNFEDLPRGLDDWVKDLNTRMSFITLKLDQIGIDK